MKVAFTPRSLSAQVIVAMFVAGIFAPWVAPYDPLTLDYGAMLASPILNPIVLWSTYVAYAGRGLAWEMVGGRAVLGLILAMVAGWAIGTDRASELLRSRAGDAPAELDHEHDRVHDPAAKRNDQDIAIAAETYAVPWAEFERMTRFGPDHLRAALCRLRKRANDRGVAGCPVERELDREDGRVIRGFLDFAKPVALTFSDTQVNQVLTDLADLVGPQAAKLRGERIMTPSMTACPPT